MNSLIFTLALLTYLTQEARAHCAAPNFQVSDKLAALESYLEERLGIHSHDIFETSVVAEERYIRPIQKVGITFTKVFEPSLTELEEACSAEGNSYEYVRVQFHRGDGKCRAMYRVIMTSNLTNNGFKSHIKQVLAPSCR